MGPSPYSLPDLRRRPGQFFFYTGLLDLVVTKAIRSGSVLTTTVAAGDVTVFFHNFDKELCTLNTAWNWRAR